MNSIGNAETPPYKGGFLIKEIKIDYVEEEQVDEEPQVEHPLPILEPLVAAVSGKAVASLSSVNSSSSISSNIISISSSVNCVSIFSMQITPFQYYLIVYPLSTTKLVPLIDLESFDNKNRILLVTELISISSLAGMRLFKTLPG